MNRLSGVLRRSRSESRYGSRTRREAGIDDQDVASLHGQLAPGRSRRLGFRVGAQVVP